MRKLFMMLLFVATTSLATSCEGKEEVKKENTEDQAGDGDDNTESETAINYIGSIAVKKDGATNYSDDNCAFDLTESGDKKSVSILMNQIKFSDRMEMSLDITMSEIPTKDGSFAIDEVIPTLYGRPMEDYTITNVEGEYSDTELTLTFECYQSVVEYSGTLK